MIRNQRKGVITDAHEKLKIKETANVRLIKINHLCSTIHCPILTIRWTISLTFEVILSMWAWGWKLITSQTSCVSVRTAEDWSKLAKSTLE